MTTTPVVFFIFRRPELTQRVFQVIRQAQPSQLLVVADGSRDGYPEEASKCAQTRAIIANVDWPCELYTNYSETNLGCRERVSSGLNWAFDIVEEAIILEDDCLPHPSFFPFCSDLLEHYRDDSRIMTISGTSFYHQPNQYSYRFSRFFHCWGWASWRRAWQYYDVQMKKWPLIRDNSLLSNIFPEPKINRYWANIFERQYNNTLNTWDYSATFSFLLQNGLHIHPCKNLVNNIGFGADSTNTKVGAEKSLLATLDASEIVFPLQHPPFVFPDRQADQSIQDNQYKPSFLRRTFFRLNKNLSTFF